VDRLKNQFILLYIQNISLHMFFIFPKVYMWRSLLWQRPW